LAVMSGNQAPKRNNVVSSSWVERMRSKIFDD
jgi:hypothetical protein